MVFIVYFCAFTMLEHKEWRFIMPIVPLQCLAIANGYWKLVDDLRGWLPRLREDWIKWASFAVLSALTAGRLAYYVAIHDWAESTPAFDAAAFVGEQDDVTGVITDQDPCALGGFFFIHHNVPAVWGQEKVMDNGFNYPLMNYFVDSSGELKAANARFVKKYRWEYLAHFGDVRVYRRPPGKGVARPAPVLTGEAPASGAALVYPPPATLTVPPAPH